MYIDNVMLDTPASWVWVCFQMVPFWNKLGWMEANMLLNMKKWLDKACMWIEYKYIKNSGGHYSMYRKENIIKSFKQAMEE